MLRLIFAIMLLGSSSAFAQYLVDSEKQSCQAIQMSPEAFEFDFRALRRITRQSCEEAKNLELYNAETYSQHCQTSRLITKFLELRETINENIGRTIQLSNDWSLADILAGSFNVRFFAQDIDPIQALIDYAVVRHTLYRELDEMKMLGHNKIATHVHAFDTCLFPRVKTFLSGETLAAKKWNYNSELICHKPQGPVKYLFEHQSCEDAQRSYLQTVQIGLSPGSIQKTIDIFDNTASIIEKKELALFYEYTTAYKISKAYYDLISQPKLNTTRLLMWSNDNNRCKELSPREGIGGLLDRLCFNMNEADLDPIAIRDPRSISLALFAVVSAEMKYLKPRVDSARFAKSFELHESQVNLANQMSDEVGALLEYFLSEHAETFNPNVSK